MGLFGKSCPQEKEHLALYGIHAPRKWTEKDCVECQYLAGDKCNFKEVAAAQLKLVSRGKPVLAKKANLNGSSETRRKNEAAAVKKAGFSSQEEKEYWLVSDEYEQIWAAAPPAGQRDVIDRLDQLRMNLEKGESPLNAAKKVLEWVNQKEAWKNRSGQ